MVGIVLGLAGLLLILGWWGVRQTRKTEDGEKPARLTPDGPRWSGWRRFKVHKRVDEDRVGHCSSFYLVPENRKRLPAFAPGQYVSLRVEVPDPEQPGRMRDCVRPYYLSDSPNGRYYRICVQRLASRAGATPSVSSHLLEYLRKGGLVELQAPEGRCPFDLDAAGPLVVIGTGAGIAPLLAVCNTLIDRASTRPVFIFYGMCNGDDLIFLPNFDYAAGHLPGATIQLCFSESMPEGMADGATTGGGAICRKGEVGTALLKKFVTLAEPLYYLCGEDEALDHLASDLDALGVPPEQIHRAGFNA